MSDETYYRVRLFEGKTYEVTVPAYGPEYFMGEGEETVFQGTLPECEAYIRLKVDGHM